MAEQLTPSRKAEIYAEWLRTGNGSAVARTFGVDEKTVRNVLREVDAPKKSALHTHALARAERDARRALVFTRKKLVATLDSAVDVKELAAVAAQVHDNARATTQMRVSHAKLMGDHAPEAFKVDADDALVSKLARLVAAAGTGEDPR